MMTNTKSNTCLSQVFSGMAELLFPSQKHKPKIFYLYKNLKQSIMETASDCRKYDYQIYLSCSSMDLVPSSCWHFSFAKHRYAAAISLCCSTNQKAGMQKTFPFVFEFVLNMELFGHSHPPPPPNNFFCDTFEIISENNLWCPVPITKIPC